jgi:type III secretion protein R
MNASGPESLLVISVLVAAVPLMIAVGTCYLKFSIVLSLLRSGFGTQQAPSAAVVMALSTVMSIIVMGPVLDGTFSRLEQSKLTDLSKLSLSQMIQKGRDIAGPWRAFLEAHAGPRELEVLSRISSGREDTEPGAVDPSKEGLGVVLGAFVVSEIKQGFLMAFFLLIPFFVIDLVVANILVGLGLTMMSPVIVSLPLKILLFVSADGWLLVTQSLVKAYQ